MPTSPRAPSNLFTLLLLAARTLAAEPELIRATDLLRLHQLESPALSPDGRWVAYVVRTIVPKPEAKDDWVYQTQLWLAATDGHAAPRPLTFGPASDSEPQWSPEGDRLAFVRTTEKEKPQIRILPLAGGESSAVTKLETGATRPRWSPDGTRLLFTSSLTFSQVRAALEASSSPTPPTWNPERPGRRAHDTRNFPPAKKPGDATPTSAAPVASVDLAHADGTLAERREWLARNEADHNPRLLSRLQFLDERDISPDLTFAHLFVVAARPEEEPRNLTLGYTSFAGGEWRRDGRAIVCAGPRDLAEHPDRGESSSLYLVDAVGGPARLFLQMPGQSLANALPSPDGRWIAFTATLGDAFSYAQAVVGVVGIDGGGPQLLTGKLDRAANTLRWTADSAAITFVAPTHGAFPLYRVAVDSRAIKRLTPATDLGVRAYDLVRDRIVLVQTTPANPSELFTASTDPATAVPLTRHNTAWLAQRQLAGYAEHTFTHAAGHTVQCWTMPPTRLDPAQKYPLLVQIHGGPSAMWGPGEESMWFEFQFFAARGYAIVFANPRGSGGYGHDFQRANYQDWGAGPASDILAAADFAARLPYVDARRQVITGGSYGGYMVAWIIGHDQRFAAAVAQRGVYDLPTFFGEGNAWRLVPRAFGGYPWQPETRRVLERESPLTYVEAIRTPLLLQHGDNDRRTGFVQSEMLLRALKVLGRDVESARYPRASHEMSRSGEPRQRLDSLVRYDEFFRRYLGAP